MYPTRSGLREAELEHDTRRLFDENLPEASSGNVVLPEGYAHRAQPRLDFVVSRAPQGNMIDGPATPRRCERLVFVAGKHLIGTGDVHHASAFIVQDPPPPAAETSSPCHCHL